MGWVRAVTMAVVERRVAEVGLKEEVVRDAVRQQRRARLFALAEAEMVEGVASKLKEAVR